MLPSRQTIRAALFAVILPASLAPGAAAAPAPDSLAGDPGLGPSTAAPWNPPSPVPGSEPWEAALRVPGKIVSLPFEALGAATEATLEYVESSNLLPRVEALLALRATVGLDVRPAGLGDRTGFGGEAQYNPRWFRALVADVSGSTAGYNRERVRLSRSFASVEYESDWRPRELFFGLGLGSSKRSVSAYASQVELARLGLEYTPGGAPASRWPRLQARAWAGPRDVVLRRGRDPRKPSITESFPSTSAAELDTHVEHFVYGVRAALDTRRGSPHWTNGWRISGQAERYDKSLDWLALRSGDAPERPFTRYVAEGEAGISFLRDPRTVRLALRVVDSELGAGSGLFLVPDLARLGGREGLSGFEPGRFQALDSAVGKLTYLFPLGRYVELDTHAEAGGVYSRLRDARVSSLKNSYGVQLRIRSLTTLLGFVGVDWCDEGARVNFSLGGIE